MVKGHDRSDINAHAFLYQNDSFNDLGTLPAPFDTSSEAHAINSLGQIVGVSQESYWDDNGNLQEFAHAFFYDGNAMYDLHDLAGLDPDWNYVAAVDINDSGQIIINTYNVATWEPHAYLLTPNPEPASLALLAVGIATMLFPRHMLKRARH